MIWQFFHKLGPVEMLMYTFQPKLAVKQENGALPLKTVFLCLKTDKKTVSLIFMEKTVKLSKYERLAI